MQRDQSVVQINFRGTPAHLERLNRLAAVSGLSQSEFLRRLLEAADTPQVTRWLPTFRTKPDKAEAIG